MGFSRSTWVSAHIYAGVAGIAGVILHITWHWDLLKALRGRSLSGMSTKLRANRVIDRITWVTFIHPIEHRTQISYLELSTIDYGCISVRETAERPGLASSFLYLAVAPRALALSQLSQLLRRYGTIFYPILLSFVP
jgi:hypothetical protein